MSRHEDRLTSVFILASIATGTAGQLLIKAGVDTLGHGGAALGLVGAALLHPLVLVGFVSYALSSGLWLIVLSRARLSYAYPLGALTYVLVVAISAVLGEHVSTTRWLGVAGIVLGVVLVNLGGEGFDFQEPPSDR